jgi:hypothetical protein
VNLVFHACTKYIELDYHFVRDRVAKKEIQIHFIFSQINLHMSFTKPLSTALFAAFRFKFWVDPSSLV